MGSWIEKHYNNWLMSVDENLIIRAAESRHIPFLIEAIISADKGLGTVCSYCGLFNINEDQFRSILTDIFEEDIEGCEFGVSSFLVVEDNSQAVACVSSWIEEADGVPSWLIRMSALSHFLNQENLDHIKPLKSLTESMLLSRTPEALQFESVFVHPSHRGKGLVHKLFKAHLENHLEFSPQTQKPELLTYVHNIQAIKAYEKLGFEIVETSSSQHPDVLKYYPDNGMIRMQWNSLSKMEK